MWHALQLLIFLTVIKVPLIPTFFDFDAGTMISPRTELSPFYKVETPPHSDGDMMVKPLRNLVHPAIRTAAVIDISKPIAD